MSIRWDDSFCVGNTEIDSDHRVIVTLINQLESAIMTGQSRYAVGNVLNVLVEYVTHHFRREEAVLARSGSPVLAAHLAFHRNLEAELAAIRDRWKTDDRAALADEVLSFLKKWLTDHILVVDKSHMPWVADGK